jgi:MOSC domain-containing protein YiiM
VVELTALRSPCHQIDNFQKGLLKALLDKDKENNVIRKAGVMGIVLVGGEIRPNDPIRIDLPPEPHHQLEYVW